jgi:sortase (surface protein transpeptidase)
MMAGGAYAIVVAFNGGPGHQMTGAATQIPASVGTSAPRLTSTATARPLAPSEPVRIEIPVLDVNAPVMQLGQNPNGSVQVPPLDDHNLAGWYDRTVMPGQDGTSVILGHVDNVTGVSVFFYIKTLQPGDIVKVVRADGTAAAFSVDGTQKVAKATFPSGAIYGNTRYPELRLITCGGPFDSATGQYLDNIIVYSHLIS